MLRGGREDPVHRVDRTRRHLAGIEYLGPHLRRRQIDEPLLMQQGQDLLTIGGRQGLPARAPLARGGGGLQKTPQFANSDDLRNTMEEAGVVGRPEVDFHLSLHVRARLDRRLPRPARRSRTASCRRPPREPRRHPLRRVASPARQAADVQAQDGMELLVGVVVR